MINRKSKSFINQNRVKWRESDLSPKRDKLCRNRYLRQINVIRSLVSCLRRLSSLENQPARPRSTTKLILWCVRFLKQSKNMGSSEPPYSLLICEPSGFRLSLVIITLLMRRARFVASRAQMTRACLKPSDVLRGAVTGTILLQYTLWINPLE